jgi:hypothetical protein
MAEYTKIKTARTIICELCNELYPDDPCEPADCVWLRMLEEDAADVAPKWISVTDRLPKAGENPVIAGNAELGIVNMAWYHRSKGIWETPSGFSCSFTHWMPLPEPPKGVGR